MSYHPLIGFRSCKISELTEGMVQKRPDNKDHKVRSTSVQAEGGDKRSAVMAYHRGVCIPWPLLPLIRLADGDRWNGFWSATIG